MKAGRVCPMDYKLTQEMFEECDGAEINTLYAVGGLYGNIFAAETIKEIVEDGRKNGEISTVALNGDSHWFDKEEETFFKVENIIKKWIPMQGNVEMEMTRNSDIGAGCGCAYPDCVDDSTVERSNKIHGELKKIAEKNPELVAELKNRPKVKIFNVGGKKICVTHGDEKLLGGWGCSVDSMQSEERRNDIKNWMDRNEISVMAVSHTCSPVFAGYGNENTEGKSTAAVINNGAAGLPNFKDGNYGLISRISTFKSDKAIYRTEIDNIYVEAVPVKYSTPEFIQWFDRIWKTGSPAEISYRERIVKSVDVEIADALIGNIERI